MQAARKINRERIVVLGWGRAILLQLAHPLVAAGVAGHSGFAGSRLGRVRRLRGTVGAMLDFTFGDEARTARAAAHINAIHRRVNGTLQAPAGGFPAGQPYSATDPALLLWVHATLLESVPLAYEEFVGNLAAAEKDAYCAESAATAVRLGIPVSLVPKSARELADYIRAVRESGCLEVTGAARAVARDLVYPPLFDPTRPAAWLNRLVTLGLLPDEIRRAYGFPWTAGHERLWRLVQRLVRRTVPLLPARLRYWREGRVEVARSSAARMPVGEPRESGRAEA